MENGAGVWPPAGVYLRYTLVPRQPPAARITSTSERVGRGQPIQVARHGVGQRPHRPRDLRRRRARPRHRHDGALLGRAARPAASRWAATSCTPAPTTARASRRRRRRPSRSSTPPPARPTATRPCARRASSGASARRRAPAAPSATARGRCCAAPRHARGRADRRRDAADRQPRARGQPRLPRDRGARVSRAPTAASSTASRPAPRRQVRVAYLGVLARPVVRGPAAVQPAHASRDPPDLDAVAPCTTAGA